jgi:hypothetical protein
MVKNAEARYAPFETWIGGISVRLSAAESTESRKSLQPSKFAKRVVG